MQINWMKAAIAGIVATLVMTMVGVWGAPMMGMPAMNPADMLAMKMGNNIMLGWAGHLMIGVILALIYAKVGGMLRGPAPIRGAVFAIAPWLVAQVMVMPMMGMGLFSGSMTIAVGSLIGHLVYGATLGAIYGIPAAR